jgi:radical SAM protein with 4Fe4S-binding SPASM domain
MRVKSRKPSADGIERRLGNPDKLAEQVLHALATLHASGVLEKSAPDITAASDGQEPLAQKEKRRKRPHGLGQECVTARSGKGAETVQEKIEELYWTRLLIQKMHLELTYRCNFRCVQCYNATHGGAESELRQEEWFKVLDQLSEFGCFLATFTGGEVFVRRDATEIMQYACDKGFAFHITTNGSLITDGILMRLQGFRPFLRCVDVSFYGPDAATFDTLTTREGSYAKTFRAVERLAEANIPVLAKYITMKDNFDGIEKFKRDMDRLGVRRTVSPGSLIPRTDRNTGPLVQIVTDPQFEVLVDMLGPNMFIGAHFCRPGHVRGAITPDGSVSPCEWLTDLKFGNLRQQSLREIWYGPAFQEFRKVFEEPNECPECDLRPACGRCPAYSYLETGSLVKCAPSQAKRAEQLRHIVEANA